MKRLYASAVLAGVTACLNQPTLVSIDPEYGYVDGCIDVVVQGHHLGTTASASIGNEQTGTAEFLDLVPAEENPDRPEHAQDIGFLFSGTVPASPNGSKGFFDVNLTVDGEALSLFKGFYYLDCPAGVYPESWDIPAQAAAGDTFSFTGCNLSAGVNGVFLDENCVEVASVPLDETCGTAQASMTVPSDLGAGTYTYQLQAPNGDIADFGYYTYLYYYGPTGDTGGLLCPGTTVEITGRRGAE